MTFEFMI